MRINRTYLVVVAMLLVPALAPAQTEWVDDPANPVLLPGNVGEWDYISSVNSVVIVDGTYHLFYMGQEDADPFAGRYQIGHATSPDRTTWTKDPENPVLAFGPSGDWDEFEVGAAAVIHDGVEFRMWYDGSDGEADAIGYATSPDGTTWTKFADNPIARPGPAGTFDDGGALPGTVIFDGETYKMWYTAERDSDGFFWTIGYAESEDGLNWTGLPDPVIEADTPMDQWLAYAPAVVFDGSVYRMWYAGSAGAGVFNIGYAESEDGVVWTKYWDNPVVPRDGIDFSSVHYDETEEVYMMWYTDLTDGSFRYATSSCCTTVYPSVIPAAAFAAGAEGSFYETDLDLSNAGEMDAEYTFTWRPRGMTGGEAVTSELFTLGAGKSVRYSNVVAEVFDLEPDAFGALVIDSTSRDLHAIARIANTPQEPDSGSFGQAMPAISPGDCTGRDVKRRLLFGTEHADMRFNVGCVNFSDKAARVRFELHRSNGTLLGTESMVLLPWANDQINLIFDAYRPVTGTVDYWNELTTGSVYCYGSVLDNVTSDPTTIPPM